MLHVVSGPPASGKTTFVASHAQPGDVRIDLDEIANHLAGLSEGNHDHSASVIAIARAARNAAIDKALDHCSNVNVWLIDSKPTDANRARYAAVAAQFHVIDPGKDVVMHRARTGRSPQTMKVAAAWYDAERTARRAQPRTTTQKGLGYRHQKTRDRLLREHSDGTPCWWCGEPMYKDKTRNPDGLSLAADHSTARAVGGKDADRLLHGSCNSARGDGANDVNRPALRAVSSKVGARLLDWGD